MTLLEAVVIALASGWSRCQRTIQSSKNLKLDGTKPGAHSGSQAYTLAEVLIAVLFIALMTVSFYAALSGGFAVIKAARENLRATQIMLEWTEGIRLYKWSQINDPAYLAQTFVQRYDPLGAGTNAGGVVYAGKLDLSTPINVPAAYQSNMLALTVTLYWTNATRNANIVRMRQMQTYIARSGLQNYVFGPL